MSTPALDRSTEETPPAIRRAIDAAFRVYRTSDRDGHALNREVMTEAVSAALEVDVIARALDAHRAIWIPGLECSCQRWPFDESDDQTMQGFARHQADAVRAAILGETKNNEREN